MSRLIPPVYSIGMDSTVHEDDCYRLWLDYRPVQECGSGAAVRSPEAAVRIPETVALLGESSILLSAAEELELALPLLCPERERDSYRFRLLRTAGGSTPDSEPPHAELLLCPCTLLPESIRSSMDEQALPQGDGYSISSWDGTTVITSCTDRGVLYGTFAYLRMLQTGASMQNPAVQSSPRCAWRMLDHWDNLDSSIERGYAGASLWKWAELPQKVDGRYRDYARLCASVGLNASVLNNVNTQIEFLTAEYLQKSAALAQVFRNYGIRVFLSVNFAAPMLLGGLTTADPEDPQVCSWWKEKVDEIYSYIPDFGGFLVKADSEGQHGPYAYGRSHAQGANMLARALAPHGGIVVWRAFVYGQGESDRAKKAYADFKPLDGSFLKNAAVQVKNGPIDFQPREPPHPLFGAMESTSLFMEFQITQEYLGQGNHLVYLAPMWKEVLEFDVNGGDGNRLTIGQILSGEGRRKAAAALTGIAGVANTGDRGDWCGSPFHSANWYAFGRLAWDWTLNAHDIALEWTRCVWGRDPAVEAAVMYILEHSWQACLDYMVPLGLHHIMKFSHHYGPDPGCTEGEREDWKPPYYHRADSKGLGFDRTRQGSGAVDQYRKAVADCFDSLDSCPEKYLLWFHHVPWNYRLHSGKTLREELAATYGRGVQEARRLREAWLAVQPCVGNALSAGRYRRVLDKLDIQLRDAQEWHDVCLAYFLSFAGKG